MRLPLISATIRRRGAAYAISWLHRISGVMIVVFLGFHLVSLQALHDPALYDARMQLYGLPLLTLAEWALALPVMFHALNGGRLVLYESFAVRADNSVLGWVAGLWLLYCGLLGATMLAGSRNMSAPWYQLWMLSAALVLVYLGALRIQPTAHAPSWKLQRLSGLFLLVMVPAHLLFMHMNPAAAKDAGTVLTRIANPFVRTVDFLLAAAALYHGAHGIGSILNDYIAGRRLRRVLALTVSAAAVGFGVFSVRLLFL